MTDGLADADTQTWLIFMDDAGVAGALRGPLRGAGMP